MASSVEICNQALLRIGYDTITSLSDGTKVANACNLLYDNTVDYVLSLGSWTVATYRATLAQTTSTPTYEYDYSYQLPTSPKTFRVLEINKQPVSDADFRIEQDKLLSNDTTVDIKYIGRLSDPVKFGPLLTEVIIAKLAMDLAYRFSGNASLKQQLSAEFKETLMDALALDGMQGRPDETESTDFTEDR